MTMSALLKVLALIVASLCLSGVNKANQCSRNLTDDEDISRTLCQPGYYSKGACKDLTSSILCEKCGKDRYMEISSKAPDCHLCSVCSENEITKSECTSQKNRECVCKEKFYRKKVSRFEWICSDCRKCTNCSKCLECTSFCGKLCKEGQFTDGKGTCQSCADHNCADKSCKTFCTPVPSTNWKLILGITLPGLVLLGLFALFRFICVKNVNKRHAGHNGTPQDMPALSDQPADQMNILLPLNTISGSAVKEPGIRDEEKHLDSRRTGETNRLSKNWDLKELTRNESETETWPAPVLYAIIRQVPVRRWKEFLRLLSLSDDQMERVELEARGSYLELQYQMLRLWSQMNGACLENIYSTLHNMDLSGCVEDLQEKLQQFQESLV